MTEREELAPSVAIAGEGMNSTGTAPCDRARMYWEEPLRAYSIRSGSLPVDMFPTTKRVESTSGWSGSTLFSESNVTVT